MLAQEVWRAWSHRFGTIVVVAHPVPDLEFFLVPGIFPGTVCPLNPLDILLPANILTAASIIVWGCV
jgi:hypothetical protein